MNIKDVDSQNITQSAQIITNTESVQMKMWNKKISKILFNYSMENKENLIEIFSIILIKYFV